jgi:hypothetical protein
MPRRVPGALLIVLMAIGSVLPWIGIPVDWAVRRVADRRLVAAGDGTYALVIVATPTTMVAVAKLLAALEGAYGRVVGAAPPPRAALQRRSSAHPAATGHRSLRGDRARRAGARPGRGDGLQRRAGGAVLRGVAFCVHGSSPPTTRAES